MNKERSHLSRNIERAFILLNKTTEENKAMKASLAAIYYNAVRQQISDENAMLAQMMSIADECKRHVPEVEQAENDIRQLS